MAVTEPGHLASREIDDLYRAHVAEVYRYAFAVLGNHADAEDVTQTTFLNAYRALEQGVRPRKPSNWLMTIASNAIKQRFRQERSRPRYVELDDRIADTGVADDDDGPTVGELLTALSKIPPQQRQAIVLREFEGRSYSEIAEILDVSTSALETLLFRARRSLAEELQHQLTCTDAQLAVSRSVDGRLGRKERRRLRDHLVECPDCAGFARMQQRHRSAIRGLALVPIPISLTFFKGVEGASASVVPIGTGAAAAGGAVAAGASVGVGATAAGSAGGVLAGGIGIKAAAVLAAASVAGGVGVAGSSEVDTKPPRAAKAAAEPRGAKVGQVAPRGTLVPGNGIAAGKASAPGQTKTKSKTTNNGSGPRTDRPEAASTTGQSKSESAKANAPGQSVRAGASPSQNDKRGNAGASAGANDKGKATAAKAKAGAGPSPRGAAPEKPEKPEEGNQKSRSAPEQTPAQSAPGPPAEKNGAGGNGNAGGNGSGGPKG